MKANQTQININPKDLDDVVCENCASTYFRQVQILKRMSALISPNGKEQRIAIPIIRCDDCGHVSEEFNQF
jgi:uncharacterized Zn finger protein